MSKGLEALNSLIETMPFAFLESNTMKDLKIIEKELKALEIIKPFLNEIIGINKYDEDFFECFIQIGNKRKSIPKEKYDLLKEILNNDD
ncbi:hypothetical protein IKJ53_03105 [bacterium]|nr:hypothetical protein [bacterium]